MALEAKAAQYRQVRRLRHDDPGQSVVTIAKAGHVLAEAPAGDVADRLANPSLVEVTEEKRQVRYQGFHVSLPTTFGGREFYRTIIDDEFLLADPGTGEVVFSFPLPMIALQVRGRHVASYAIQGVDMSHPSKHWERNLAEYRVQFTQRRQQLPEVFNGD